MPQPVDRSAQRQLQRLVGELGQVQPYMHSTDRAHRSVGWWVRPARAKRGCGCPYCAAARSSTDLYLGYNRIDAIVVAELGAREHAGRVAA